MGSAGAAGRRDGGRVSGAPRDWLADAEGTSRRLAAEFGLSGDAEVYGEICANCDARWALAADRASCPHLPICEDCYPNGCEACQWQEHETLRHREEATNRILSAALEVRTSADDLSETDLRHLGHIARHDVLRHTAEAIEKLRFVHDVLARVEREAAELRESM